MQLLYNGVAHLAAFAGFGVAGRFEAGGVEGCWYSSGGGCGCGCGDVGGAGAGGDEVAEEGLVEGCVVAGGVRGGCCGIVVAVGGEVAVYDAGDGVLAGVIVVEKVVAAGGFASSRVGGAEFGRPFVEGGAVVGEGGAGERVGGGPESGEGGGGAGWDGAFTLALRVRNGGLGLLG